MALVGPLRARLAASGPRVFPQWLIGALLALRGPTTRRVVLILVLLVGFLMEVALILVTAYLVDLSISLMELWAELARKHLELTM